MSRFVWEVTVTGGDPTAITEAVRTAIINLRAGVVVGPDSLHASELEPWAELVAADAVDTVSLDGKTSVLVEVETSQAGDPAYTAAVLSGGFDTAVLHAVMSQPGVESAAHSDRIQRSEGAA